MAVAKINLQLPLPIGSVALCTGHPVADEQAPIAADPAARVQRKLEEERTKLQAEFQARSLSLHQATAAALQAGRELAELRDRLIGQIEMQATALAMAIARKVLAQEIAHRGYDIDPIVEEALAQVPRRGDILVRMNPDDHARSELAEQDPDPSGLTRVQFVPDPSIAPAGCVVECREGHVDRDVASAMDQIHRALGGEQ